MYEWLREQMKPKHPRTAAMPIHGIAIDWNYRDRMNQTRRVESGWGR